MNQYPKELKESIIARMSPPDNVIVPELTQETVIPKDTLYSRRSKAWKGDAQAQSKTRSEETINIVLEAASLNEVDLGELPLQRNITLAEVITVENE